MLSSIPFLQGQFGGTDWSNTLGGNGNETIEDVLELSNNQIVSVGKTTAGDKGGIDGLVVISDFFSGQTLQKIFLGGQKEDVIQKVVQHWDGSLVLAGYTSSKGKYSQEAWLINITTDGTVLWEKTYGSTKRDNFSAIGINKAGQIVAAGKNGSKKGKAWLTLLDKGEIKGEYLLGKGEFDNVSDLIITAQDKLILTGTTSKGNGQRAGDIWLVQANFDGAVEWQRTYGGNNWEEGLALTQTNDGGYALAGLTKSKGAGETDMWIVKTNPQGDLVWDQTYGGGDEDIAHDIIQTYDGGFAMVGITKSHSPGARRYNMSLIKTAIDGSVEWEKDFGGNREDLGNCLAQLHDGSIIIGGSTSSSNNKNEAWLLKTLPNKEDIYILANAANNNSLLISNVKDIASLRGNDQDYLTFDITNKSNLSLVNIFAEVSPLLQVVGINFQEKVMIGTLMPQQTKQVHIPISGGEQLQEGMSNLQINILSSNRLVASTNANVFSKQVLPAALAFGGHYFNTNTTRSSGSYKANLELNIQNFGEKTAQKIQGRFIAPTGVKSISEPSFTIEYLRPNSTHIAVFDFIVDQGLNYPDGKIPVECIINEQGSIDTIRGTFTLNINRPSELTSGARSPRSSKDLIWLSPNPDEQGSRIITDKDFVDIKIKAVSNNKLKADDFTIYLNNSAQDGSKIDPPSLSPPNRKGASYTQTFDSQIQLKLGKNIIEVEVYDEEGNVKTIPIEITYAPERPNLHILAIGPTHEDLKYTGADAKDFANAFANQENKLFNKVFIKSLSEKETTNKDDIQKALLDLQFNYEVSSEGAITDKDLLIVFISSHAKRDGRNFLILPSDYSPKYEAIYSLDYERDIVHYLKNINCKKLMFIDACNSGAAYASVSGTKSVTDDGLAKAINQINSTLSGMSTFTSCRKREKSYEDEKWQNGAFTEAILEALQNQSFADKKGKNYLADTDKDGILTIGELKTFLANRVPYLVKNQKKEAPTSQVPLMTNNELGDDFPLFVLER